MSILAKLHEELLINRRAKMSAMTTFYSTLIGECTRKVKEPTDEECQKVFSKMIEDMQFSDKTTGRNDNALLIVVLQTYMPTMLTESDILKHVLEMKATGKALGDFMRFMKTTYGNKYDGALARKLFETNWSE